MSLYEIVRYLVILRAIDEWRRAKAILCYYTEYNVSQCARKYGMSKEQLRGIITRAKNLAKPLRLSMIVRDLYDIVYRVVPILVDNYVAYKRCRVCGFYGKFDIGNWVNHFERKHHDVLYDLITKVVKELKERYGKVYTR